ncbi:hypothetical protein EON82_23375, partial [bacterium]
MYTNNLVGVEPFGLFRPFLPDQVPDMGAWFDASAPHRLFQSETFTSLADEGGDSVGGWQDRSGHGPVLTQTVSGNRPTLSQFVVNGHDAVLFNGTSSYMTFPTALGKGLFADKD